MRIPLIYIAAPFSAPDRAGVDANIRRAEDIGIQVAKLGAMPIIPHANTQRPEFEKVQPYEFWIDGTMELLRRCDAILMGDGWESSGGATKERAEAERLGKPILDGLDDVLTFTAFLNNDFP